MKLFMPTILLLVFYLHGTSSAQPLNKTTIMVPTITTPKTFYELAAKRIHYLWTKWNSNSEENTFIGRCLGAARKLKLIMPLIIFKLGVILTVLVFLTIFSMKSLGLLFMLLMMNASGAVAKLALLLKGGNNAAEHYQKPQNVHFHIHQTKDGHYHVEPNNVASWNGYERSDFDTNQLYYDEPNNYEQLQRYKLFNNLYNIENR